MSARILMALSGGVDSAVAAALLAGEGHELVGVFMRNGVAAGSTRRSCCSLSDARDARAVADHLGFPFYVHDLSGGFDAIVRRFAEDYAAGLTPNPCVACNNELKFGALLDLADDLGLHEVATGHYARLAEGRLLRGSDRAKDQSYVLHGLTRVQLARARFPLGALTKPEVRCLAASQGLPVAEKPDSAEICFVPGGDYRALVRERLGHLGAAGEIVDARGRTRARHAGVAAFTVGQRRGLGLPGPEPSYVTGLEPESGTVRVGPRAALRTGGCRVGPTSWLRPIALPAAVEVQLRHHHGPERGLLEQVPESRAEVRVRFEAPSEAVTPGQFAVFYDGDEVLGGGRIHRPPRSAS